MKNFKSVFALILAAVIAVSFAACKAKPENSEGSTNVTESATVAEEVTGVPVTDKDGKTVTDKNGKAVTVTVSATTAKAGNNSAKTTAKNNKNNKTTKVSTTAKVKNPNTVKKIKISNVTESSVKLSWEPVVCDFYELQYQVKDAERWDTIDEELKASEIDVSGLESLTEYSFRLRAIIKSKAGKSESKWTYAETKTKAQDKSRKITVNVKLPARNSNDDKLVVYIKEGNKDKVKLGEFDVKLDGSTVKLDETKDKYKGVVTVEARLKTLDEKRSVETDKDTCTVDISQVGIDIIYDED